MTWAEDKIRECIRILRTEISYGSKLDAIDLADRALWSEDPFVRDARGYLEAWADVADMTVGELIGFVEGGKRLELDTRSQKR